MQTVADPLKPLRTSRCVIDILASEIVDDPQRLVAECLLSRGTSVETRRSSGQRIVHNVELLLIQRLELEREPTIHPESLRITPVNLVHQVTHLSNFGIHSVPLGWPLGQLQRTIQNP